MAITFGNSAKSRELKRVGKKAGKSTRKRMRKSQATRVKNVAKPTAARRALSASKRKGAFSLSSAKGLAKRILGATTAKGASALARTLTQRKGIQRAKRLDPSSVVRESDRKRR